MKLKWCFEKAAKFCKYFTLLMTTVHTVKSKVKILQNFVAFSEYMNFINKLFNWFVQCFQTKQFMEICVKNCAIDLKKNNLYLKYLSTFKNLLIFAACTL